MRAAAILSAIVLGVALVVLGGPDAVQFTPCPDRPQEACATVDGSELRLVPAQGSTATRVPGRVLLDDGGAAGDRPELSGVARIVGAEAQDGDALARLRTDEVVVGVGARAGDVLGQARADGSDVVVLLDPPADLAPTGPPLDLALVIVATEPPAAGAGLAGITTVVRATPAQRGDCAREQVARFVSDPFGDAPRFVDCSVVDQAVS